jgi:hypothetical protein
MTHYDSPFLVYYEIKYIWKVQQKHAKHDTLNQMGIVATCYNIFFHKDLSIFSLFYNNPIFEI